MKDESIKKGMGLATIYLKRHRALVAVNVMVFLVVTVLEGLRLGMIIPLLESIGKNASNNIFMRYATWMCNLFHVQVTFRSLLVIFGTIMLVGFGMLALQQYLTKLLQVVVTDELRKQSFQNLMELPLSYYYKKKVGDIIATIHTSAGNSGSVLYYLMQLAVSSAFCFIYMGINILISIPMTVIACILAILSYSFMLPRFKAGFGMGKKEKEIVDKFSSFLLDKLNGIKTIKSFNTEKVHEEQFKKLSLEFKKRVLNIQVNRIKANLCMEPFLTLLVIVLVIMASEIFHITIAPLVVFFYIFSRMIPQIKAANHSYMQIMELLPHLTKVEDIISRDDKTYLTDGELVIREIKNGVRIENVWFRYNPGEDYVLKDISIDIERGKTTAIVGGSGGGKTTLIGLLARYYDPEKGCIKIDGIDLRDIRRENWHYHLGIVEQDAYLFYDTMYNNIMYGKLGATRDEVERAAELAHAHKFIMDLPDGYDTVAGERGMKLSGGQKQRIALARALIRDPEILILDEATSALDSESEKLIQDSIAKLSKSKTIIIIAHRLSTIAHADKIIVIENGRVIEEGTAEALLKKNGIFKKYHSIQTEERT